MNTNCEKIQKGRNNLQSNFEIFIVLIVLAIGSHAFVIQSEDLLTVRPYIGQYFDIQFYSQINYTTNYVKDGNFESRILSTGSVEEQYQTLTNWIPQLCNSVHIVKSSSFATSMGVNGQSLILVSNGEQAGVSQTILIPTSGFYYIVFQFSAVDSSPPQKQLFKVIINQQTISSIQPWTKKKHFFVARSYMLAGNNTLKFQGETFLGDAVVIDNVRLYSKNVVNVVEKYQTFKALEAGLVFSFLSADQSHFARPLLNSKNAWCSNVKSSNQYFQISASQAVIWRSIMTQGYNQNQRSECDKCCSWVKNYTIQYTTDGFTWYSYNSQKIFQANTDSSTIVTNEINLFSKSIRIFPSSWNNRICMRVDATFDKQI